MNLIPKYLDELHGVVDYLKSATPEFVKLETEKQEFINEDKI